MAASKAFGMWSAVFLGIGSMVGAGIFIVIGEAGAIAGNLVTVSFFIGAAIALLCGYSLARLAVRYPSRGGIIEYLVQGYGEGFFSGTVGILFYLAQLVALAAVAKSFGTYAATYMAGGVTPLYTNAFVLGVLGVFVAINLLGAAFVARSENMIVSIKVGVLLLFTVVAMSTIEPERLLPSQAPGVIEIFYTLGLTFFAYQGFSVITNSVEDMQDPETTMLRSIVVAIALVALLYVGVSVAVFGNLPLSTVVEARDYALAEAAKPVFGTLGFKVMAATALLATASAINATLYAVTQISYTLAKEGDLPEVYEYNVFHNTEGLLISAVLIVPMILFFNLAQIATVASIAVLLIQGITHVGHLFRYRETGASLPWIVAAIAGTFGAAAFAVAYTMHKMPHIVYDLIGLFAAAFAFEVALRLAKARVVRKQVDRTHSALEKALHTLKEKL